MALINRLSETMRGETVQVRQQNILWVFADICRGIRKEMELQYVLHEVRGDHAMPVYDTEPEDVNQLIRHHRVPRRALFIPLDGADPPVPVERFTNRRSVHGTNLGEKQSLSFEDDGTDRLDGGRDLDRTWTGHTVFHLHPQELATLPEEAAPTQFESHKVLKRKRTRTRQLQRGLWTIETKQMTNTLVELPVEMYDERGASGGWIIMPLDSEVAKEWKSQESAQADIRLIMMSRDARRLRKPQPHLQAAQAPLRKTVLLMTSNDILSTGWED